VKYCFSTAKWFGSNVGTAHFVRDKRVPIGSVPFGDSCSVGQFRATGILKCLLPVLGTYSVLPYA
jgi:hypothetical protein